MASIRIGHEPLEYTGDTRELLLGSMTALSILLPLLLLFDCAVMAFGSDGTVYIVLSNVLFGAFYLLAVSVTTSP